MWSEDGCVHVSDRDSIEPIRLETDHCRHHYRFERMVLGIFLFLPPFLKRLQLGRPNADNKDLIIVPIRRRNTAL